jgi:hypothetical protein
VFLEQAEDLFVGLACERQTGDVLIDDSMQYRRGCLKANNYAEGSKKAPWPGQPAQRECAEAGIDEIITPVRRPDLLLLKKMRCGLLFFLHVLIFYRPGREFLQVRSCKTNPDLAGSTPLQRRPVDCVGNGGWRGRD